MAEVKCVHCGKMVYEMAVECPYCKNPIANPNAPTKVSASPWTWKKTQKKKVSPLSIIVGVLIAVAVIAAVYYLMMSKP